MAPRRKQRPSLLRLNEADFLLANAGTGDASATRRFNPPFPLHGIARTEWERITAIAFWIRETDALALADRCLCFQRMLEAEQDVIDRGSVIQTRAGKVVNPSIRIARGYRLSLQRHDAGLGLNVTSRSRLDDRPATEPSGRVDRLEQLLCGKDEDFLPGGAVWKAQRQGKN